MTAAELDLFMPPNYSVVTQVSESLRRWNPNNSPALTHPLITHLQQQISIGMYSSLYLFSTHFESFLCRFLALFFDNACYRQPLVRRGRGAPRWAASRRCIVPVRHVQRLVPNKQKYVNGKKYCNYTGA